MPDQDEQFDLYADLLDAGYELVTDTVESLAPEDFARPTRASAWTIQELLYHQLLDAQRALVALASTTTATPDVDQVSYWREFRPGEGDWAAPHAEFVQKSAAAFPDPASLVGHWRTTSRATVRAARATDPASYLETQGHVLAVPDLLSTLVVESTVHLLDLTVELTGSAPTDQALALTRSVLEGLAGAPLPSRWDDTECVLKGTGRVPLDDADRDELGEQWRPLLG